MILALPLGAAAAMRRRPAPDKGEEAMAGIYDKSDARRLIAPDQAPFYSAKDISGGRGHSENPTA